MSTESGYTIFDALKSDYRLEKQIALGSLLRHPAGQRLTLGILRKRLGNSFRGFGGKVIDLIPLDHPAEITPPHTSAGGNSVNDLMQIAGALGVVGSNHESELALAPVIFLDQYRTSPSRRS